MKVSCIGAALFGAAALSASAASACQIRQIAELHVTLSGNQPLVDAEINGKPVRFMLDTGSSQTILSRSAAKALGLKLTGTDVKFYGVGGSDNADLTVVREFKLGGATASNLPLLVTAPGLAGAPFVGLIGRDVLTRYDLELDLANNVIRIMRPKDCAGEQVAYWAKSYSQVDIAPSNEDNSLDVMVKLNNHAVLAELDSGASTTVVTSAAAAASGVRTENLRPDGRSGGVGRELVDEKVAVFPKLSVGDETVSNARLRVADLFAADRELPPNSHIDRPILGMPEMLLGADFIRAHRIFIANSQHRIYFTYNGGSIFQVEAAASAAPTPTPTPTPAPPRP